MGGVRLLYVVGTRERVWQRETALAAALQPRPPFVDRCPRLQPSELFPILCSALQLDGEVVVVDMGLFDDNDTVVARIVNFQLIHINSLGVFARL